MSNVRHNAIRIAVVFVALVLPAGVWGQSTLNFPRAANPAELGLTGFAIVNPGPTNAQVTYRLYDTGGQVVATSSQTIPARGQLAKLGLGPTELFQQAPAGGWVQATSATTGLQGFWLGGDFTTFMDGAAAAATAADLVFPLVSEHTEINVVNPDGSPVTITLRLYGADGTEIAVPVDQALAGYGFLQRQVSSLFPGADLAQPAHVQASCTGQCAGTALLSDYVVSPSLGVINAISAASTGTEANFPQIVSGVGGGGSYTTIAGVVNLSPTAQSITWTFTPASGSPQFVTQTLPGNGAIRDSVENLFGFSPDSFTEGWVKVSGSAPLTAFAAYGDTVRGGLAIVPVQDTPRRETLIAHIADLPPWSMGLALLNTGATDAIVEVYAMTPSGSLIGGADNVPTARFTISPGKRRAALLSELIPQTQQRTNDGGFVFVHSSEPLYGMGLFFTRDLAILADVALSDVVGTARVVIDSYTEPHEDGTASLNRTRTAVGQIFTPSVSAYLHSSEFYLSRENSPTGTMVAKLFAVAGTAGSTAVPTGSPLATSAAVNVSTLHTWPAQSLVTFDFTATPYLMSAGVPYAMVVEYPGGTSINTVTVGKDSSGTHAGNKIERSMGTYSADSVLDTVFYVYGYVVDPAQPGTLQLSSATYSVNENGGTATITISRTGGVNGTVGATFSTGNGTATQGSDYAAVNQTVSFTAGDAVNKTITIPIMDDPQVEANETVNLTLSSPTGGASLGSPDTAVVTIVDNDSPQAPTIIDSYSEANYEQTASLNGTRFVVGQVFVPSVSAYLRSCRFYLGKENSPMGTMVAKLYAVTGTPGSTALPIGSPLATSSGVDASPLTRWPTMALVPFDFTANQYLMSAGVGYAIVVEYTGGSATNTITVGKNNAGTHPGNKTEMDFGEWHADALYDTVFYVYGDVVGTPQPGTFQLSSASYSVNENGGSIAITVTRSGGSSGAIGATLDTSNGTATAGSDYTAVHQTVSFSDGDAASKTVNIPITDDAAIESSETVNITLSSPTGGASLGLPSTAVLTIADNDSQAPTIIDSYSEANYAQTASLNDIRQGVGQIFVPSVSAYLRLSKFYLGKENNPTGTMVAKLYAVTGMPGVTAVPTGSPLAISAPVNVSPLTLWPIMALSTFDFAANQYLMSAGVPYAIVVEFNGGSAANTITVGKNNAGTHPGNKTDLESGIWIGDLGLDTIFYIYGDVTP